MRGPTRAASAVRRSSSRTTRAVAVTALAAWTQACTVMRPVPSGHAASPRAFVRAEAPAGMTLAAPAGELTARPLCLATRVEGEVAHQAGDTLVLARVYRAAASPGAARCPQVRGAAALLRTPDVALSERQLSKGRTAALVVGLLVAVLAFAAYAASQIEYDFSDAGNGGVLGAQ